MITVVNGTSRNFTVLGEGSDLGRPLVGSAYTMKNPSLVTVTFREVPSTALVESVPVMARNQDQTADSLESPGMFPLINMSQVSARCSVTKLNFFRLPQLLN